MPLTPADVHNVAFSKPPIGKRGYNEDEVDQFLDLVEDTLAGLQDENADLRSRLGGQDGAASAVAGATPASAQQPKVDEAAVRREAEARVKSEYDARVRDLEARLKKAEDDRSQAESRAKQAEARAEEARQ
ncbi:cell division protein, partial [Corynebacterium bovis]